MSTEEQSIVLRQAEGLVHTPLTSSCGRLFDAVASIMNVRQTVTYEAQAAIEFEMIAGVHSRSDRRDSLKWLDDPYPVVIDDNNGHLVVNLAPLLQAVASDAMDSVALPTVSRRFHATIARVVLDICERLKTSEELNLVALSGGCFQNRLLLHLTHHALVESGFDVLLHRQVPPNDGGIALGQAAVATASISSS
ncbi:MAG: carbamoyltransferase HypF, partial [Chloroflexota bacterium]